MIYFIQEGEDGPIKIGVAGIPQRRLLDHQVSNSRPLRLIGVLKPSARITERELHAKFQSCRIRGEWFSPTRELLSYIRTHKWQRAEQVMVENRDLARRLAPSAEEIEQWRMNAKDRQKSSGRGT